LKGVDWVGFNGNNLKTIFDQRFGKGAFDSGVNQAYQNGRNQWLAAQQAQAQQDYLNQMKQQEAAQKAQQKDPVYKQQNAQNYFQDASINKELHTKGAFQWVKDLQNDPMKQAELKKAGYDVKAIADQAYNVASNGKFKSASAFGQYFKDLNTQTQTANKAAAKQEGFGNTSDWWDAKLQQGQAENKLAEQQQLKAADDTLLAMHNDAIQRQVQNQGIGNFGDEFQRGVARFGNTLTLGGLGELDKKLHGGALNPLLADRNGAAGWLDKGVDFAGSVAPFLFSDGATSTLGGAKLAALGGKGMAGKVGELAIRGAGSGALVGAGQEGVKAGFNPQQFDLTKALENVGIDAGVGAVANPLLHGAGGLLKQLNLNKQLTQVLEHQPTQVDPETFVKTLQDMKKPTGDVSNVVADQTKVMPTPFETRYNLKPQIKPEPTVKANDLKQNDWFNFTQQQKNIPKSRNLFPNITVPKRQSSNIRSLAEDTLNRSESFSNKPPKGFNQRLLDVQQEMKNLQNKTETIVSKLKGDGHQDVNYKPDPESLYQQVRQPDDPKTFDNLVKMAEMEHNQANPSLTTMLRLDPRIKQSINKLNSLGNPTVKVPKVETAPKQPKVKLPELKSTQNPHDFLRNLKINSKESGPKAKTESPTFDNFKVKGDISTFSKEQLQNVMDHMNNRLKKMNDLPPEKRGNADHFQKTMDEIKADKQKLQDYMDSKEGKPNPKTNEQKLPKLSDIFDSLIEQKKHILTSIKTDKNIMDMSKEELTTTLSKLEKKKELLASGGKVNAKKVAAVEEDIQKVNDFLVKMDLQKFGEKELKDTPKVEQASEKVVKDKTAQEKAIAKARQEKTVKKFESKGNILKTEAAKMLENSDKWKSKGSFSMGRETATRVFEDVTGKDSPGMIKKYIDPVKSSEADRVRFLNEERGKIKEFGIKPGSKEDELVQMYGEKKISLDELKQKAPKNWENIVEAEKHYRGFYDDILDVANKTLKENGFPEIPKRQDYFPHFQEIDGVMRQLGFDIQNHTLPTDINGLTENFRPQKSWFSNALRRTGEETDYGAAQGFDKYIEGISNVIYHTKNIKELRGLEDAIRTKYEGDTHLNNFASWLKEYTNQLAGKKAKVDRVAEEILGRKIFGVLDKVRSKTGMNMVGANVGSAMTNFIPLTQSLATTSKTAFTKGLTQTLASLGKDDGFIAKSDFLTKRMGSESLYKTWSDKVTKKSMWLMSALDHFTSNVVVRSKFNEGIAKGLSEQDAMKQADEWASKLMAGRAKGDLPTLMNSKTLGLFTQFQLEVNNQVSFLLKDIPKNAVNKVQLASQLGQVLLYGYLFNNLYEKATGRRPAIDPIGIAEKAYQDYHNDRLKKGTATTNLISNIAGQLPMGTQLAQTAGLTPNTSRVLAPFMSSFPNVSNILSGKSSVSKEILNPLTYLLLPAGGNSIKKAIEGLDAYNKGGVHNGKGQLQYPVAKTTGNAVRGALFGKSSFPEAQSYYNNNESALSDKQTKMVESGARSYQSILQQRHNSDIIKKIKEIQTGPDSPDMKAKKVTALMAKIKH
jgi:hypothetical protein